MTDLNLNSADCIKSISHIGSTTYVNICSGTHVDVPWGSVDWLSCAGITLMVLAILTLLCFMFLVVTRDF